MPDLLGPLTRVTPAFGLWVAPLAPLLAAAFALYAALAHARTRTEKRAAGARARAEENASLAAILGAATALGASAVQVLALSRLEEDSRFLLEHVLRIARVGQLDVTLDLASDSLSALIAVAVSGVALLLLSLARAQREGAAFFGWSSLLLAAALLAVFADGLLVTLMGWEVAAVVAWGLTRDARGLVVGRVGDASLLVGVALVFWGFGGTWTEGDYTPDLAPRFSAVRIADAPAGDDANEAASDRNETDGAETKRSAQAPSKGALTLTSYPGALVFMDDSRTPLFDGDAPARAPFRKLPIDSGLHSFRIHPGSGLDDHLVSRVLIREDRDVALTVSGSTVTYHQLRDQLEVQRGRTQTTPRAALAAKDAGAGAGFVTLATALLLLACAARSGLVPLHGAACALGDARPLAGALPATIAPLLGAHLLLRMSFFVSLSSAGGAIVACAGALTAVVGAVLAARADDLRRVAACLGVSEVGLVVLGAGVGVPSAAAVELVVSAFGVAALWACAAALEPSVGTELRALGGLAKRAPATAQVWRVATMALWIAPAPVLGGFWSKRALLSAAFATRATSPVPGALLFALGVVASGLGAFAAWRAYLLAFEGEGRGETTTTATAAEEATGLTRAVMWTLAGAAVFGGVLLAVSGGLLGRGDVSLARAWLASIDRASVAAYASTSTSVEWGLAAVLVVASFVGYSVARARFGGARNTTGPLFAQERAPVARVRWGQPPGPARIAEGIERWVLDGVYAALAAGVRGAAVAVGALDDKLFGGGLDAAIGRSARFDLRTRAALAAACIAAVVLFLYLALHVTP